MTDPSIIAVHPTNGRNGSAPRPDPLPDFSVHLPSLIGREYNRLAVVPYTPDLMSVAQDPLLAKKGLRYIDEMLRDDMVEAGLSAVKSTVLSTYRVIPANDSERAKWVADGFSQQLEAIPGGFLSKLHDQLSALDYGFCVQEIELGLVRTGDMSGYVGVKDILFRLPHFFEFPTDPETGALLCLNQRNTWGGSECYPLRLDKALYLVWNAWADPFRGRSILRPAYEHWYAKQQFIRFRNDQGERAVGKVKVRQTEATWPHADISFKDAARKVIENYHFSRAFTELFGMSVEVINNEMSPSVFSEVIEHCNAAILRAIGVPSLAIEQGSKVGSFALGKVHQDSFLSKLARLKSDLEELVREQLFRKLIHENALAEDLCPSLDLSPVLEEDKRANVGLYLQARAAGALEAIPQDANWLRGSISAPEVDEADTVAAPTVVPENVVPMPQPAEQVPELGPEAAAAPGADGTKTLQQLALNGAQIASALSIITGVAGKQLPYTTGVEMLVSFLLIDRATAERIMKPFLQGFVPASEEPQQPAAPAGRVFSDPVHPILPAAARRLQGRLQRLIERAEA